MPRATSAASKSSILPRAWPDSARAIINSALKVRISPSDSSMMRSSAARYSASLPDFASASSARLRNRAEEALAKSGNEAEYRAALERIIEESDGLIRTFNALLMIARAESGQARGNMDDFDAAEVARG